MRRPVIALSLCAALLLCSCADQGEDQQRDKDKGPSQITAVSQKEKLPDDSNSDSSVKTDDNSSQAQTAASAAQTDEPARSAVQTDESSQVQQGSADSSQFLMYTDTDCKSMAQTPINADGSTVNISCSVRIDQLFSGLRDKEAEMRDEERLERERFEKEKLEREELEHKLSGQGIYGLSSPAVNADAQQYGYEFTAKSTEEMKDFLSYYYELSVVEKYAAAYNDAFFKTNNLLLKVIIKPAGNKTLPEYDHATGSVSTGTITVYLRDAEVKEAFKQPSSVIVQAAVSKSNFSVYGSKAVKWDLKYYKYYDYPLAKAKLNEVGWELASAFKAAAAIPYYGHTADMPQDDKHTTEWYANFGFTFKKGNCYVMAAMFCEMARLLGYNCVQISGRVPLRGGGYGAHSWCEVRIGSEVYVCDPDFTNETGYNGYFRKYGESGTWKYIRDTVLK